MPARAAGPRRTQPPDGQQRLTRERYFEAGLDLLAEGGAKAVTIAGLCHRLHVTTGSFYHHFDSAPVFMRQLLSYWETAFGHGLADAALAVADVPERIETLKNMGVGLRHEAETAIRALARTDPYAAEVQHRVDAGRVEGIARTLREAGIGRGDAKRLAEIGVAILVGVQDTQRPVDRRRLRAMFDDYQRWLTAEITARTSG